MQRTPSTDSATQTEFFPLLIVYHDKTFEDGAWPNFPPLPPIWMLVIRWLYFRKHKGWWRFSGCTCDSTPKKLPFA